MDFIGFLLCRNFFCVALNFTLKVEAGGQQLGGGLAPPWAMQALLLPSASDSLWSPLPDPIPLLLGEMSYTTGIKTITSIQQRTEKGWR